MGGVVMSPLRTVSLFSGIGLLDLGLERAGIETALLCERDPKARAVLTRHWPNTPLHHDVSELTPDDLYAAEPDPGRAVLAAGFPCQDLSMAGRRAGMGDGTRSGLYWHTPRLLADYPARWVVLENVPGLLSAGCSPPCPGGCTATHGGAMGAVVGSLVDLGYGLAWRVLDAQYAGVPQRRRRVVIVGHLGTPWGAPAEVLFDPESSSGDHPPQYQPGPRTTGAPVGRPSQPLSPTLTAHHGRANVADEAFVIAGALMASTGGPDDNAARAGHIVVSGALTTGGGKPVVAIAPDVAATLTANPGGGGRRREDETNLVAFNPNAGSDSSGALEDATGITPTLTAGRPHAIAFHLTQDPVSGTVVPAIGAHSGGQGVMTNTVVRRLTPLECERLQGAPDGWTAGQHDSPRYRQLGNAVAAPVFTWVGRRIVAVDARLHQREGVA